MKYKGFETYKTYLTEKAAKEVMKKLKTKAGSIYKGYYTTPKLMIEPYNTRKYIVWTKKGKKIK